MKSNFLTWSLAVTAALVFTTATQAQQLGAAGPKLRLGSNDNPVAVPQKMDLKILSAPIHSGIPKEAAAAQGALSTSLQTFDYSFTASKDGFPYTATIVGRNPFLRGKLPTHTTVPVIPLIITFTDTGSIFDPTMSTPCTGGHTVLELTQNSPIFQPYAFTMNGVNVGPAQYIDAFQRAEFWSQINGANYHTDLDPTYPGVILITVFPSAGFTSFTGCAGKVGFIDLNQWDPFMQSTVIPLAQTAFGVNATQFPLFLLSNVYWYIGNTNNCCVLGYHNAYQSPIQTYSPTTWDSSGIFGSAGQDSAVMSHEVGEWANDPYVNNATPAWGGIGQVGGCQGNFEVGDPLTGTQVPPVAGINGFTYHLQELGFLSWYYNSQFDPSLGAGGKFSNNGHFGGPSKICPPGGTF